MHDTNENEHEPTPAIKDWMVQAFAAELRRDPVLMRDLARAEARRLLAEPE